MKLPRPGLKPRFVAACLLLVSISTAGYYLAVAQFVEFFEAEQRDMTLLRELDDFVRAYERDPGMPGPHAAGLDSYVLPLGADPNQLPPALRDMKPGTQDELRIDGREVAAARQDVKGSRLYVVLDLEPLEAMEAHFVSLAWLCALISWAAAIALALWLAQKVLRPVSELADRVGRFEPGQPQQRLSPHFDDPEIGMIAAAFDRYLDRMEAFVSREQAFTEDASHELRTPLSVIDSAAQLLAEDRSLGDIARERVQRIQRAVLQMQMLIEALLYLAREEGSHASEDLALHQMAAEIAEHSRELVGHKPVHVEFHGRATRVRAPRGMASCVITNLLHNAIHFTDRGLVSVGVEPGLLWVQDTGIGIPPEALERVFERRFRGAQSRGLGLGLYLVKRICDRLGWSTSVSSDSGVGTRFEVRFPSG